METTVPATVTLKVTAGELRGKEFAFAERTTCVLGRASDCSPRLPDDENHRTISRHHCLLDINPPDIRIRDFGSLNGTYVNGVKIGQREAHQTPEDAAALPFPEHDLSGADEITLGETVFRVCVEQDERGGRGESPTGMPRQCANCGRPVDDEAGARAGHYLCAVCQAEPEVIVKRLLRHAGDGERELAAIAGYTLLRELGRGGMGAVYLARHDGTGEQVALKVMLPRAAASSQSPRPWRRSLTKRCATSRPSASPTRPRSATRSGAPCDLPRRLEGCRRLSQPLHARVVAPLGCCLVLPAPRGHQSLVGDAHGVLGPVAADAVDDISDGLPSRVAVGPPQQEQWCSHLYLQPCGVLCVGRYCREAAIVAPNLDAMGGGHGSEEPVGSIPARGASAAGTAAKDTDHGNSSTQRM
jgi:pSer/pThr/pTyr-binding forkhead associated (FHA) protein